MRQRLTVNFWHAHFNLWFKWAKNETIVFFIFILAGIWKKESAMKMSSLGVLKEIPTHVNV